MAEKKTQPIKPENIIALPPLKMVLVHARNEDANKASLVDVLRKSLENEPPQEETVDADSIRKLIVHLEKKKKSS